MAVPLPWRSVSRVARSGLVSDIPPVIACGSEVGGVVLMILVEEMRVAVQGDRATTMPELLLIYRVRRRLSASQRRYEV